MEVKKKKNIHVYYKIRQIKYKKNYMKIYINI